MSLEEKGVLKFLFACMWRDAEKLRKKAKP